MNFASVLEKNALIRKTFALLRESYAFIRESYAFIREKYNVFFSAKKSPIGFHSFGIGCFEMKKRRYISIVCLNSVA